MKNLIKFLFAILLFMTGSSVKSQTLSDTNYGSGYVINNYYTDYGYNYNPDMSLYYDDYFAYDQPFFNWSPFWFGCGYYPYGYSLYNPWHYGHFRSNGYCGRNYGRCGYVPFPRFAINHSNRPFVRLNNPVRGYNNYNRNINNNSFRYRPSNNYRYQQQYQNFGYHGTLRTGSGGSYHPNNGYHESPGGGSYHGGSGGYHASGGYHGGSGGHGGGHSGR